MRVAGNLLLVSRTRTLWRRWRKERDQRAFEALVQPELRFALDLARRAGAQGADADDAVQESLVLLAKEASDDPVRIGLRAWIGRRVVLRAKMQARSGSRRRRHERRALHRPSRAPNNEARDEVEAALKHVDPKLREAIILRYLHDLDYSEVAYVLGVSVNACRLRVHKGLKRLRALLGVRAAGLLAVLGVPAITAEAGLIAGAVTAAKKGGAIATGSAWGGGKAAVAATALTAAVATGVAIAPPEPAPAIVHHQAVVPAPVVLSSEPTPAAARLDLALRKLSRPLEIELPPMPEDPEPPPAPPKPPTGLDVVRGLQRRRTADDPIPADPVPADLATARRKVPAPAKTIELGAGTHTLTDLARRHPGVDSLAIRGAGMGKTVIACGTYGLVRTRTRTFHLRLSDVTLDAGAARPAMLTLGGESTLLAERVRFRGWEGERRAGSIAITRGGAYIVASECEFVGGYRGPRGARAFYLGGPAVLRFDECRFYDMGAVVSAPGDPAGRAAATFANCSFENAQPGQAKHTTIRERGCDHDRVVRTTVGGLRRMLLGFLTRPDERVVAVTACHWHGNAAPYYVIDLAKSSRERRRVVMQRDTIVKDPGLRVAAVAAEAIDTPRRRQVDAARAALDAAHFDTAASALRDLYLRYSDGTTRHWVELTGPDGRALAYWSAKR